MRKKRCEKCEHVMKEGDMVVIHVDKDSAYFCCDIFGIVDCKAECNTVKRKKITDQFYASSMKEVN